MDRVNKFILRFGRSARNSILFLHFNIVNCEIIPKFLSSLHIWFFGLIFMVKYGIVVVMFENYHVFLCLCALLVWLYRVFILPELGYFELLSMTSLLDNCAWFGNYSLWFWWGWRSWLLVLNYSWPFFLIKEYVVHPLFFVAEVKFLFSRSFFTIDLMSLDLMVGLQRKHSDQSLMHLHIACILKLAFNSHRLMLVSLLSLSCVSSLENYVWSSCLYFKVIGD